MKAAAAFVTDMREIRRRARKDLDEGAVTKNYGGGVKEAISLLNHAVPPRSSVSCGTSFTP